LIFRKTVVVNRVGSLGITLCISDTLARQGLTVAAIAYAEARRKDDYDDRHIIEFCERVLLNASRREQAYQRYGLYVARANEC